MTWSEKTISPTASSRALRKIPASSPPLMRFLGSIGFSLFGLGTLYLGSYLLGIDWDAPSWDAKAVVLFVLSIVMALVGMLLGLGIGATVEITSERTNHVISTLWHYLANGFIIWSFLLGLILTKTYGNEGARRFVEDNGLWRFSMYTLGIGLIGCVLIGGVLLLAGLVKANLRPRMIPCLMLSVPIAMAMGYFQFAIFQIDSNSWIFVGVALPVALIPLSAYMMNRDRYQREQILDMGNRSGE